MTRTVELHRTTQRATVPDTQVKVDAGKGGRICVLCSLRTTKRMFYFGEYFFLNVISIQIYRTVYGSGMGLTMYTGMVRQGQTSCEATEWKSETAVRCWSVHGFLGTRRVVLTVGQRGGSMTQVWSADVGLLSTTDRGNQAGTGAASITVHGNAMGLFAHTTQHREGWTKCEATEWESESSVRCLTGSSTRGTQRAVVTAGGLSKSVSQVWSVDLAGISSKRRNNQGGTGSASVTVHGASMELALLTGQVREGQTGCEATEWGSETSIRCMSGQGVRGTRRVSMTVGDREGSLTQSVSVDIATASMVHKSNRAGTGSASVTVHGTRMGLVSYTGRNRKGHTGCEATEWESETSMRCRVSRVVMGSRRLLLTSSEGGRSVSQAFSADIRSISALDQCNRAGTGSASLVFRFVKHIFSVVRLYHTQLPALSPFVCILSFLYIFPSRPNPPLNADIGWFKPWNWGVHKSSTRC